ncbi:MAG TPA: 30S ribosomal protein S7 [Nitrospiria bacterium]|jgi:small subunit ribosomal protein S7
MPRKKFISQREILPDPKFHEKLVGKFINTLMRRGKKSIAETICYGAFEIIKEKTSGDPLKVFKTAVDNVKPLVEVKSRRVGGASYQVPVDIRPVRRNALALRWIVQYAGQRPGKSMKEKLAGELMDAAGKTGGAIKKKEDTHRMAEANKTFAHYRW